MRVYAYFLAMVLVALAMGVRDGGAGVDLGWFVFVLAALTVLRAAVVWTIGRFVPGAIGEQFDFAIACRRRTLVVGVAGAVAEEVLYRGAVLPALGLWPSSFLFGFIHSFGSTLGIPTSPFVAVGLGALLGWSAVVLHVWINATAWMGARWLAGRIPEDGKIVALPAFLGEQSRILRCDVVGCESEREFENLLGDGWWTAGWRGGFGEICPKHPMPDIRPKATPVDTIP